MKTLIVTALALALTACSSTPTKQAGNLDPEAKASAAATRLDCCFAPRHADLMHAVEGSLFMLGYDVECFS